MPSDVFALHTPVRFRLSTAWTASLIESLPVPHTERHADVFDRVLESRKMLLPKPLEPAGAPEPSVRDRGIAPRMTRGEPALALRSLRFALCVTISPAVSRRSPKSQALPSQLKPLKPSSLIVL